VTAETTKKPVSIVRRSIDEVLAEARCRLERLTPPQAWAAQQSGALLVDIRPAAYRLVEGEIPGSLILERNVLEWRLDPTCEARIANASYTLYVVVVCNEGYTSSLAAAALHDLGVDRATDLVGGYRAWRDVALPTVPGGTPAESYAPWKGQSPLAAPVQVFAPLLIPCGSPAGSVQGPQQRGQARGPSAGCCTGSRSHKEPRVAGRELMMEGRGPVGGGTDQERGSARWLYRVKRWMYRSGRPGRLARVMNRISAVQFSAGVLSPRRAMTLEVPGRRTGRLISLPVVVADYAGERYLVAMLQNTGPPPRGSR
jgi:rhodanese-related sulfurtransferase